MNGVKPLFGAIETYCIDRKSFRDCEEKSMILRSINPMDKKEGGEGESKILEDRQAASQPPSHTENYAYILFL